MGAATRRSLLGLAVAAGAVLVAGRRAQAHDGHTHHRVEIGGFKFAPARLAVRDQDTVTFVNRDIAPHTATAVDRSWDTGTIAGGAERTITVARGMAGDYFCRFHPAMKARLDVA